MSIKRCAPACFVTLPAIIFYYILFRHVVNVPIADDYYALFNFLNHLTEAPNLSAKAYYLLVAQHNEYKLFFEHALFWVQVRSSGLIDLRLLCIVGDTFCSQLRWMCGASVTLRGVIATSLSG